MTLPLSSITMQCKGCCKSSTAWKESLAKFVLNQQYINNLLNYVEEQINLPGGPQMSVGDIVAINSGIIQENNQSLSQKADKESVT